LKYICKYACKLLSVTSYERLKLAEFKDEIAMKRVLGLWTMKFDISF
jgi:hypothetical protein